ncbi:hypothetical protein [Arthrobacter sp. Cr_A7]|uniref:hypothetical protein n=1 Tax=Arthrobacter sp. Cr_A7 TaxID=3031017 RepID=UPI0023DB6FB9|nr:hypothetical protein [Arthrobacter sp. Cr_A7]MDF2050124.1 hypothetical protein [Arthrobacter sp. Cr_A7]
MEAELPLKVLSCEVNDPIINLIGNSWSLTLMCPWAVHGPNRVFDWESPDLEDEVQGLVGRKLVTVEADSDELFDPVFVLDDGTHIHVFADTDLDPWTMGLPEIFISGAMRK